MSRVRDEQEDAGKGSRKRGSTNNASRLQAFARSSKSSGGDWGACDPFKLRGVIVAITGLGGAVTIGLSRDGGAHSMTLLLDGERETLWFNGNADLNTELDLVLGKLESIS